MKAYAVMGAVPILAEHHLDGKMVLETTCHDYADFVSLPGLVRYRDVILKKTGWSSDSERACYQQTDQYAREVV